MAEIKITTAVNLDDSQFKSGINGVETMLKKLSTTNNFVKLKFDESDFRAQYQSVIKEAMASVRKAFGVKKGEDITYKNAKGNSTKIDTIGSMKTGYKYALAQMANDKLTQSERDTWKKRADSLAIYLNILKQIGQETKNVARQEKEIAEMPFRKERAKRSAEVAYQKRQAYRDMLAPEMSEKQADKLFRGEAMAKLREADRQALAAARAAEREQAEIEKRKTKLLQEESRKREKARRDEAASFRRSIASRDKADTVSNKIIAGGSTNAVLANMRMFYTEQARAAEQANKAEERSAKKMQQEAERTVASQERVNRAFRTQSRLLSGLTRLAMRYFSVFTVLNVGRKIVETTGFFEQQRVALEGIFNSAEKARDAIEQIKQMALKSPFETKELIGGAKQLSAYGIDKDELLETTKMLGDLSAGLGVDMSRLILAYGQVKSATVLRGQELRQFTEAGVPIVEKLAEKLTEAEGKAVSTKDVFEYISKRKVPFEMVESVLKDMTSEGGKFFNMQENLTDTLYGQVQKLKDVWTLALNDVGSGWGRFLRNMIEGAQTLIKNFRMVAATIGGVALGAGLTSWGRKLLDIANNTKEVQKAQALVNVLVKTGATQQEIAAAKTKVHVTQMRALAVAAKSAVASFAISAGFTAVIAAIGALIGKFIEAQAKAREFQRALADVDLSINKDSTAKKNGLDDLIDKLGKAKNGTKEYEEALSALKGNYSEYINPKYLDYLLQEGKTVADNAEEWKNLANNIKRAIDAKAEVQRHRERAEVSRNSILDDFKNDLRLYGKDSISGNETIIRRGTTGVGFSAGLNLSDKEVADVRSTIEVAAQEFFDNAKSAHDATEEVFKARIQEVGKRYGLSNQRLNVLINNAGTIFEFFKHNNVKWEEWLKELELANKKSWEERIQDRFSNAYQSGMKLDKKDYNKWGNVKSEEFDPFFQRNQVLSKTLDVFTNEAGNKLKGFFDNQIYFIDNNGKQITKKLDDIVINGKEGAEKYRSALKQVNDALGALRDNPSDWQALYDLSNALFDLNSTLQDTDINNYLNQIINGFQQNTTVPGDALAVQINSFIDELVRKEVPMVLDASEFKRQAAIFEKWKVQNDAEYFAKLGELYKKREDLEKKIANLMAGKGEGKEAEVKKLKDELRIVNLLIDRRGYWQPEKVKVNKPKRTPKTTIPNEDVEYEVVEWISKLKEAYTTYRNASQQFGAGFGIDFMKGDEHMKKMFAEFFNGVTGESFKNLQKTKVGKNSNETLYSVLKDTFITSGMEDGVMNFEKAALAMSEKLNEYYNKDTQHRKRYLQVAKELERWALSISKDNLAARAKELSKALTDITESFQRTSKNVDLYGKMIENGTYKQLGGQLGVSMSDYLRPESERSMDNVMQLLSRYNQEGQSQADLLQKEGKSVQFNSIEFKSLDTLKDIESAIQTLTEVVRMNEENFGASNAGTIAAEQLKKALENLFSIRANELTNIKAERYTGNGLSDAIDNAAIKINDIVSKAKKTNIVSTKDFGRLDETTLQGMKKEYADLAEKIYQEFLKKSNIDLEKGFDALGGWKGFDTKGTIKEFDNMMEKIEKKLKDAGEPAKGLLDELRRKADKLKKDLNKFEMKSNPVKVFFANFKDFANARKEGKDKYLSVSNKKADAESELSNLLADFDKSNKFVDAKRLNRVAELKGKEKDKLTEDERVELDAELADIKNTSGLTEEDIDKFIRLQAVIADCNDELSRLGKDGREWASDKIQKALENMKAAAIESQKEMSDAAEAMKSVLNSAKAFSDSLNKLYDVMNDGENPEWMQDMSEFMGDMIDNFEAIMAPIMGVITLIITLTTAMITLETVCTPLLIIMLAIIAVAVVVAAIIAAVQQNDRRLERQIEDLKKACEEMEHQMKLLDEQAERSTGWDAYSKRLESVGLQLKEVNDLQKQMELEDAKKNTDEDKLDEYRRSWELAKEEFLNSLKDIREELTGSVQNWADAMSSAIRSAFQNGENAARNFRDTVMESIGDIVETMLKMSILQPSIQAAMDNLLGGSVEDIVSRYQTTDENGKKTLDVAKYLEYMRKVLGDGDKMQEFYDLLKLAGDTMIEGVENLPEMLKAAYGWNSETSSLTGGIQGITEDTARTLEGLGNSGLAQLVQQTGLMQSMLNTGIAQVQLSWFDNMIQLQRQLVANSDYVHNAISEMRVGNRPLVVKMQ